MEGFEQQYWWQDNAMWWGPSPQGVTGRGPVDEDPVTRIGDGESTGSSSVVGELSATAAAVGVTSGSAGIAGSGRATAAALGAAQGSVVVDGRGAAVASALGQSAGVATVLGVGPSIASISIAAVPVFRPTASTDRQQLVATATYVGGVTSDVTLLCLWSSSTPTVATVDVTGKVAAVPGAITSGAEALSTVTASYGGKSGQVVVTVDTDVDATKGWRIPVNEYQWSLMSELPFEFWDCQAASGNLVGKRGNLTLTALGAPAYAQTVSGWSQKAVALTDGAISGFNALIGQGPNPINTSQMWLAFVYLPAAPGVLTGGRVVMGLLDLLLGSFTKLMPSGVLQDVALLSVRDGAVSVANGSHCVVKQLDVLNAKSNTYSELEKVVGVHAPLSVDLIKGLGGTLGLATAASRFIRVALWTGADAERSTAAVATLVNKLTKTTVSWS